MNWSQIITRYLSILLTTMACLTFAAGQTPLPNQPPAQPIGGQPAPQAQQMPDHLVGVEAGKIVRWTLKDAILAALEKNPDIEIGRQNVRLAQFDFFVAKGVYDR